MIRLSPYRFISIIFLIMSFSLWKSVFAVESNLDFQFNDPIASYNDQDISRQQFLDFIEASSGLKEKDFSEASTDLTREYIESYVMYQELSKRIKQEPIYNSSKVQEALGILSNYIVADLYDELEDISEGELETFKEDINVDEDLSMASLLLIAQSEEMPQSEVQLKDDTDLHEKLVNIYHDVAVKAYLGDQRGLKEQRAYQLRYDWAVKNYLSNLYIQNYLDSIFDQKEVDETFDQWLTEQNFFEYKIAHVYVLEEESAQDILDQLKNQKVTFEEAVTLYSQDLASNEYQGKLGRGGWVSFPQEDHPFASAVVALEVGAITEGIVKGIAGYHIIRLDDKRATEGPYYIREDGFKEGVWQNKKREELFDQLKTSNKISIYL